MVEFPDLPGCFSCGDTVEEAKAYAKEALTGWLASMISRNMPINDPSKITGDNVCRIEPESSVAFALFLRKERGAKGRTQGVTAEKLGIRYQPYQRLEDPTGSNPTLKTIKRPESVFDKALM